MIVDFIDPCSFPARRGATGLPYIIGALKIATELLLYLGHYLGVARIGQSHFSLRNGEHSFPLLNWISAPHSIVLVYIFIWDIILCIRLVEAAGHPSRLVTGIHTFCLHPKE